MSHEFEAFDIEAGRMFVLAAIVNSHFLRREVTHVFSLVIATFGWNVDERLIEVCQEFKTYFHRCSVISLHA